jgi:predicted RND superfamily exporter protein
LVAISDLTEYLGELPDVGKALSIADPLVQLARGFVGAERLPASEAAAEQYLLLLESVDQISDVITEDRRAANVMLRVDNNGSRDLLEVAKRARDWWDEFGPAGFTARVTGIMYEYARAEDEIATGQLRGLGLALIAVSVVLITVFRRARLMVLAIVPNAVPLVIIFGMMGLLGLPVDAGTVFLGSLALGIAVDDTIHVVWRYQIARRRLAAGEAVAVALARSIVPIAFTTVAVAAGFAVLYLSSFVFIQALGWLTATIMILCYLSDVTLLPALLARFDQGPGRE